jgi:hypothetical protein
MTRKVRRALGRSRDSAKATLSATAGSLSLARAITLRPELSPARVASRGLKLAGICSSQCTMSARLTLEVTVTGAGTASRRATRRITLG